LIRLDYDEIGGRYLIRKGLKDVARKLLVWSLLESNKKRGEAELKRRLVEIVPDISKQYTTFCIASDDTYLIEKVRTQHAFQIGLALKAIDMFIGGSESRRVNIVDIGDSSGTHLRYLSGLTRDHDIEIMSMSVNLDPEAVRKIRGCGLPVIQCRAEELHLAEEGIAADIFLSYEMLEHLFDPISFLHSLAGGSACSYFVITVPSVRRSRVGLHHIRRIAQGNVHAENTHIFELCPEDWDLIYEFSGWNVLFRDRYTQYPERGLLHMTKYLWRRIDFDGFYGVILKRNPEKTQQYQSW
jgi:hypothetical protein